MNRLLASLLAATHSSAQPSTATPGDHVISPRPAASCHRQNSSNTPTDSRHEPRNTLEFQLITPQKSFHVPLHYTQRPGGGTCTASSP
ncbi:hypothetical protein E2C01_058542 [Portunus trituberculatus]|uniref:Secreted protein n=1 Tax=Portunus trituberculatus TaxID=210409 RepID=A0A5B7H3G5_PORTR|nr:hypothetical protein [Portunus trituberculatus]